MNYSGRQHSGPNRNKANCPGARGGFTLIEVLVALAICGVVVLSARLGLEQLANSSRVIMQITRAADAEANADRELHTLFGRLDPGYPFIGDRHTVNFETWCEVPSGWLERCQASIRIAAVDHQIAVIAALSAGSLLVLKEQTHHAEFRYLVSAADGGFWAKEWSSRQTTPLAVAIIDGADTTIVGIGSRS